MSATTRFELRRGELRLLIAAASPIGDPAGLRSGPLPSSGRRRPALRSAIALGDAPRSLEAAGLGWSRFAGRYFLRALGHGPEIVRTQAGSISAAAGRRISCRAGRRGGNSNTVNRARESTGPHGLVEDDDRPTIDRAPKGELWDDRSALLQGRSRERSGSAARSACSRCES
jgi:hypothetical protein